jgi:hypothetical protein
MPLLAKLNVLRGLRFRLTITNSIFLIGLLIAVGFFFRGVLSRILDNQVRDILQEEWVAVKSYLVIHKREPNWRPDPDDPEETLAVQRLQRVFLLADAKGKVIEVSPIYEDLGVQTPAEIMQALALKEEFWQDKRSSEGEPFRLRGGAFIDDDEQTYFVVIGRSMYGSETVLAEFTKDYFMLLPGLSSVASCSAGSSRGAPSAPSMPWREPLKPSPATISACAFHCAVQVTNSTT